MDNHSEIREFMISRRARRLWTDWERVAGDTIAFLHVRAARRPYDEALVALIGELSTRSDEFRIRWARHGVRAQATGARRLHHPVVCPLELTVEVLMPVTADDGQALIVYGAEPDSASADGLRLLAGWAPSVRS